MATITEVAKEADVSVATVSRVLNDSGQVSESLKRRVMKAVEDLNYQPNLIGRMLRCAESKTILVVFSILLKDMIAGIKDAAVEAGYEVILQYSPDMVADPSQFVMLQRGLADGAILAEAQIPDDLLKTLSVNYPVVQCGQASKWVDTNTVSVNYEEAAFQMTQHLLDLGCRRIATVGIVSSQGDVAYFSKERLNGVHRALQQAGISIDTDLHYEGLIGYATGIAAAENFLKLERLPDAVFCFQDSMAFGLVQVLNKAGVNVPQDIAVSGFDNSEIAKVMTPPLTSVDQPIYEIGREAVRTWLLVQKEGDVKVGRHVHFDARIVLRESTEGYRRKI